MKEGKAVIGNEPILAGNGRALTAAGVGGPESTSSQGCKPCPVSNSAVQTKSSAVSKSILKKWSLKTGSEKKLEGDRSIGAAASSSPRQAQGPELEQVAGMTGVAGERAGPGRAGSELVLVGCEGAETVDLGNRGGPCRFWVWGAEEEGGQAAS